MGNSRRRPRTSSGEGKLAAQPAARCAPRRVRAAWRQGGLMRAACLTDDSAGWRAWHWAPRRYYQMIPNRNDYKTGCGRKQYRHCRKIRPSSQTLSACKLSSGSSSAYQKLMLLVLPIAVALVVLHCHDQIFAFRALTSTQRPSFAHHCPNKEICFH